MTFPLKIVGILKKLKIPTEGLVAYYPFNGNADDESGNGNNGIVNGAVLAIGRKGNANHAYQFVNGEDDYIDISSIGHLPEITISMWAYFDSGNNLGCIGKNDPNTVGDYDIVMIDSRFRAITNGTSNIDTSEAVAVETWYHVVYTYDGTTVKIYLDSVIGETDLIGSLNNNYTPIKLGQYYNSGSSFNGRIDDVRFYNRALNVDEIYQLYNE